jgi:hypothetical protein
MKYAYKYSISLHNISVKNRGFVYIAQHFSEDVRTRKIS